jgi:hypothetical protein
MERVRQRIECDGERFWLLEDLSDLPHSAVAQALSRLSREGMLERLSKGVYYRARGKRSKAKADPTLKPSRNLPFAANMSFLPE